MSTEETDIRIETEETETGTETEATEEITGSESPEEITKTYAAEEIAETELTEEITEAEEEQDSVIAEESTGTDESDGSEQPAEDESFGVTAYIDMGPADTKKVVTDAEPAEDETTGEESGDTAEEGEAEETEAEEAEAEAEKDPEIEAIKNKIRERKREKKRKARLRRVRFWTLLAVLLISIAALIFSLSSFFVVDSIEVRGNSRFTAEEIINIAHAVPGRNIIYNPGTTEIVQYLEQNPFIKSATVTRKLPSTLVITVNERKQACAFRYDDDYLVMDDEGILLSKTRTEPKITMINGMVASKIKLGETIGTKNQQMFSKTLKLIRDMNAGDLYFVTIDMSEYEVSGLVRAYVYDKLVVKSDYDLLLTNINNGRLHKVLETLFADGVKRGTITLNADGTAGFEPGL